MSQVHSVVEPQALEQPAGVNSASNCLVSSVEASSDEARRLGAQLLEPQCGCSTNSEKPACSCSSAKPAVKMLREVYSGAPALQKAYALGRLSFDFPDDARRDAVTAMLGFPVEDRKRVATALKAEPQKAEGFLWTIEIEGNIPICVLQPQGPFARDQYVRILEFFDEQENGTANSVAIPGYVVGEAFAVNSARVLPLLAPDLEGMRNMNLDALLEVARQSLIPPEPEGRVTKEERQEFEKTLQTLDAQFLTVRSTASETLSQLYDENTGLALQSGDRARVFVTIDFGPVLSTLFGEALQGKTLELTATGPSRDTPTGRDYQDVSLSFFNPTNTDEANVNVTFVIDVSDVKPRFVLLRPLRRTRGPVAVRVI